MADFNSSQEINIAHTDCHTQMGKEGLVNAASNCRTKANVDFKESNAAKFDQVS